MSTEQQQILKLKEDFLKLQHQVFELTKAVDRVANLLLKLTEKK